jgi:hypothetical protein
VSARPVPCQAGDAANRKYPAAGVVTSVECDGTRVPHQYGWCGAWVAAALCGRPVARAHVDIGVGRVEVVTPLVARVDVQVPYGRDAGVEGAEGLPVPAGEQQPGRQRVAAVGAAALLVDQSHPVADPVLDDFRRRVAPAIIALSLYHDIKRTIALRGVIVSPFEEQAINQFVQALDARETVDATLAEALRAELVSPKGPNAEKLADLVRKDRSYHSHYHPIHRGVPRHSEPLPQARRQVVRRLRSQRVRQERLTPSGLPSQARLPA